MRKLILALAACSALAACEKRTAKFHAGDKVMVKLTEAKGVIKERLSPFSDDLYYLRVPAGKAPDLNPNIPDALREYMHREWPKWYADGPYYDTELVLTQ